VGIMVRAVQETQTPGGSLILSCWHTETQPPRLDIIDECLLCHNGHLHLSFNFLLTTLTCITLYCALITMIKHATCSITLATLQI